MTDTFKYANAVVQNKSMYLKDAEKYEEEMATSSDDSTNPDEQAVDTQSDENPTPKEKSVPEHDWEKRHSDLKSYMDRQLNTLKSSLEAKEQKNLELQQQLKEAKSQPKTYPVSDEEITQWAAQFPDFHKTLVSIIGKMNDQTAVELHKEIDRLEGQSKAIAAEKGRAELLKLHPDANEIEKDPQFATWFEKQKPRVRSLIESADPYEIADGLKLYKIDMNIKPKQKNSQDKEASMAITVNSRPETPKDKRIWTESEVARMSTRTYAKNEQEIEKARQEGRFEYDLSAY